MRDFDKRRCPGERRRDWLTALTMGMAFLQRKLQDIRMPKRSRTAVFCLLLSWAFLFTCGRAQSQEGAPLVGIDEVLAAKNDVWGLAAMRQTNGPSYEFFEPLLPPLRYVNAAFHYYPIVLSAPNAPVKARLVSNGSGLNVRGGSRSWKDFPVPVKFLVGEEGASFGGDIQELEGPRYSHGYLPIVEMRYQHHDAVYEQETFAAVDPALASNGIVFVRFSVVKSRHGQVTAQLETNAAWIVADGAVRNTNGETAVWFDLSWTWDASKARLTAKIDRGQRPTLAFATRPVAEGGRLRSVTVRRGWFRIRPAPAYDRQREECVASWQSLLDRGSRIVVPEERVNNAWRSLVASLYVLVNQDRLNYGAGNGYQRQYEAECGDAVRALLLFGHVDEARRTLLPLLDYVQEGLRYHDAAFKLQMLSHYFWLTRDTNIIAITRKQWRRETGYIMDGREAGTGLLPRENYCGDIPTQVYSLNSSANCWRGLRDFAAVLEAAGDHSTAQRLREMAREFRRSILDAVAKSEDRSVQPPFIPVALFGEEKPYDALTSSKLGGYWCLMAPYILGSGVFGPGAEREYDMVNYLQEHGGVAMGLIRFDMHAGLYANSDALDDLYGLRYTITLLALDEVDRALVSFYGKLAQGLTRDTFVGAEGTGLRSPDGLGRPMFLPPNSSSQAYFLWMLRYLLAQDLDLDDDGTPETLRLCFATPRPWLEDGKIIEAERLPTAFGDLSMKITSRLSRNEVVAELDLPTAHPARETWLRIRLPEGWRVVSAQAGPISLAVDERGTVRVPAPGHSVIRFKAGRAADRTD